MMTIITTMIMIYRREEENDDEEEVEFDLNDPKKFGEKANR